MSQAKTLRAAFYHANVDIPELKPVLARRPEALLGFAIAAEKAIAMWERLRAVTPKSGYYPIVVADAGLLEEVAEEAAPAAELLTLASRVDPVKWLRTKASQGERPEAGEWPEEPPSSNAFVATLDAATGKPRTDVKIVLLPTPNPWEAAAHLGFSAVNYDIEPQHHVAVHQKWFKEWGAEPVTATGDVMEFRVTRPPTNRAKAKALAAEQYAYCPDIVDQGVGTLENLGAAIMGAPVWFFWWD